MMFLLVKREMLKVLFKEGVTLSMVVMEHEWQWLYHTKSMKWSLKHEESVMVSPVNTQVWA